MPVMFPCTALLKASQRHNVVCISPKYDESLTFAQARISPWAQ